MKIDQRKWKSIPKYKKKIAKNAYLFKILKCKSWFYAVNLNIGRKTQTGNIGKIVFLINSVLFLL